MTPRLTAILYALLAALFYGMSAPFSKLLLAQLSPHVFGGAFVSGRRAGHGGAWSGTGV